MTTKSVSFLVFQNAHWIFLSLVINLLQHFSMKKVSDQITWGSWPDHFWGWIHFVGDFFCQKYVIFLALLTVPSYSLWFFVLSRIPISVAVPLLSLNYLLMAFVGYLFFGEALSLIKIVGIMLIIGGVTCMVHS